MVSNWAFSTSLTNLKEISGHTMDANSNSPSNDEVTVLDVIDYFGWRSKMKDYLKKFSVWEIVINPPVHPSKKTKTITLP